MKASLIITILFITLIIDNVISVEDLPDFMLIDVNINNNIYNNPSFPYEHEQFIQTFLNINNNIHKTIRDLSLYSNNELFTNETQQQYQYQRNMANLDPIQICDSYNNATKGILTCECDLYEFVSIEINCTYDNIKCVNNNTFCYDGYISTIISSWTMSRLEECVGIF